MQVFGVREKLLHNFMESSNKIYLFFMFLDLQKHITYKNMPKSNLKFIKRKSFTVPIRQELYSLVNGSSINI